MTRRPHVISAFLILALAACGDGGGDGQTSPTTTDPPPSTTSTTTPPSDEDQVRQLVEDWYDLRVEAVLSGTYDDEAARQHLTGRAYDLFVSEMDGRTERGERSRRPDPDDSMVEVVSAQVDGDDAVVEECTVDPLVLFDEATGEVLDDRVVTYLRTNALERTPDGWRIAGVTIANEVEGIQPCDEL